MKTQYKIRTHGNINLANAIVDELIKLGYSLFGCREYSDIKCLCTDGDNDIMRSSVVPSGYEEITINELITLRIKHEEVKNEGAIKEIRQELEAHNKVGEVLAKKLKELES